MHTVYLSCMQLPVASVDSSFVGDSMTDWRILLFPLMFCYMLGVSPCDNNFRSLHKNRPEKEVERESDVLLRRLMSRCFNQPRSCTCLFPYWNWTSKDLIEPKHWIWQCYRLPCYHDQLEIRGHQSPSNVRHTVKWMLQIPIQSISIPGCNITKCRHVQRGW